MWQVTFNILGDLLFLGVIFGNKSFMHHMNNAVLMGMEFTLHLISATYRAIGINYGILNFLKTVFGYTYWDVSSGIC